jgi:hypothetical protein
MTNSFPSFADHSKVWIYGASQAIPSDKASFIQSKLSAFTADWTSHQNKLHAEAHLINDYFLVFMVDESQNEISGCGIDKSVSLVREISDLTGIDFFNRMDIYLFVNDKVLLTNKQEVVEKLNQGLIDENTLYFDNLVANNHQYQNNWLKPIKQSWFYNQVLSK